MIVISLFLFIFIYVLTISHLIYGFDQIKTYKNSDSKPKTYFAIVVPFRNESSNLGPLLDSIKNLNYPKNLFEIILVDDFSEDDSVKLIYNWRMENGEFQISIAIRRETDRVRRGALILPGSQAAKWCAQAAEALYHRWLKEKPRTPGWPLPKKPRSK